VLNFTDMEIPFARHCSLVPVLYIDPWNLLAAAKGFPGIFLF
jgi:hypothetical protein